uniref:T9SS type A sorting domain-containing protein n=1 Tax=candidate division WOR-3 bacterium TaxID=2052148 RepID=A0A7C4GHS0_UNCW3
MKKPLLLLLLPVSLWGQVVVDTIIHLPLPPANSFYLPELNKLYISSVNNILVLDCATFEIVSTIPTRSRYPEVDPAYFAYNWRRGKLYTLRWYSPESIIVIDTHTDSVVAWIPFSGTRDLCYVSSTDRVYGAWRDLIVIDCETDSVVRRIPPQPYQHSGAVSWDSVGNKVYVGDGWFHPRIKMVYSCVNDSLLKVFDPGVDWPDVFYFSPARRRAYYGPDGGHPGVAVLDTRRDSVIKVFDINYSSWVRGAWNGRDDKVYLSDEVVIYAIDCATDSVVSEVPLRQVLDICWVPWSNRLYASVYRYTDSLTYVAVLDCRNDSLILTGLEVGSFPLAICADEVNQRVYVCCRGDATLYVLKDVPDGVAEERSPKPAAVSPLRVFPSPARDRVWLEGADKAALFAPDGRRAASLTRGKNDIRSLPRGIYFVRVAGFDSPVAKVILSR